MTAGSDWLERHPAPVALALFAAALALVLPMTGAQSIWFDEAVTLSNAQQSFDLARNMRGDATPPLYPLLVHLWMRVFGATIESARALSALASAGTAALLFQLGRRFLDARTGLFAALLFGCSRFQIFFAHEARPYAVVVLLCTASFYVLLAQLESPTRRRVVLLGLLDAALLYTHYVAVFALAAQGLAVLPELRRAPRTFFAVLASQVLAVVLVLPLVVYVATTLWPLPMAGWLQTPTWRTFPTELAKLTGSSLLLALEAVLVVGGIAWVTRQRTGSDTRASAPAFVPRQVRVLALWAFAPLVVAYVVSFVEPVFLGRYLLYTAPGLFLLIAYVAARLPVAAALRASLVLALCALSLAHALRTPIVRPAWGEAATRVRAELREGALAVVVPAHELLPFAYHFAPRSFAEPARVPALLRGEGVVGLARLADVPRLAGSGRDLLVLAPEATAAGAGTLTTELAALGYVGPSREDMPGLVLLRFSRPPDGTAQPAP